MLEAVNLFFSQQVPAYLRDVRIPESVDEALSFSSRDWLVLVPLFLVHLLLLWSILSCFVNLEREQSPQPRTLPDVVRKARTNTLQRLEEAKVVDHITPGPQPQILCRCWRSKTFPLCDGSHAKHNLETGDNIGPIIVEAAYSESEPEAES